MARNLSDKERDDVRLDPPADRQDPPRGQRGHHEPRGRARLEPEGARILSRAPDVDWLFLDENELKAADLERHNKAVQAGTSSSLPGTTSFAIYKRK